MNTDSETLGAGEMIRLSAVIRSASGEHLARIMDVTDYEIDLDPVAYYHAVQGKDVTDELFDAELTVELYAGKIDLRGHIPAQVGQQLAAWSKHLMNLAVKVATVRPEQLILDQPRAHIIRNMVTGEVFEAGPFHNLAMGTLLDQFKETGEALQLNTGPIAEWPESAAELSRIVQEATDALHVE